MQPSIPGGTPYGLAALKAECAAVRAAPEGDRNNQLYRSAFAPGQLVSGGELPRDLVEQELTAAALGAVSEASRATATQHVPPPDPPPSASTGAGEWHCDTCQRSWTYPLGSDFLMAHGIFGDALVRFGKLRAAAEAGAMGGPHD